AEQREIPDDVEYLVTNELVGKSQPFAIHDAAFACQDNRVFKRASANQSRIAQRFKLACEAIGSSRSYLPSELPIDNLDLASLSAYHRMRVLDKTRNQKSC